MGYTGVLKAAFSYAATSAQELTIAENDILYLIETADDGWWTVKKRVPQAVAEEPQGLVPHNYVEPATPIGTAKALFDYQPQTSEEIPFSEGARFDIYASDGDWVLVGVQGQNVFGFVPFNYIESDYKGSDSLQGAAASNAPQAAPQAAQIPEPAPVAPVAPAATATPRPPMDYVPSETLPADKSSSLRATNDDAPPPMPQRPRGDSMNRSDSVRKGSGSSQNKLQRAPSPVNWEVLEVNGRRKHPKVLTVSATEISLVETDSRGEGQSWDSKNILSYSNEKKHVFLEMRSPRASLDLKAESQSEAAHIITAMGQVVGAQRGGGLQEVVDAANTPNLKSGTCIIDFKAVNAKELSLEADEVVTIVDDFERDWWLVRNVDGKEGKVPSKFISINKSHVRPSRPRSVSGGSNRLSRSGSTLSRSGSKKHPDSRKMRVWVDRSGSFRVDAQFLGLSDGKVHLHKSNGVKIAVPVSKLSFGDIEYVEKATGKDLSDEKPLADKLGQPRLNRSKSSSSSRKEIDEANSKCDKWLEFFLGCGVDVHNGNRYAKNFTRDNMDESMLAEVNAAMLRTFGLREGDVLRVMRFLNDKYNRTSNVSTAGVLKSPAEVEKEAWSSTSQLVPQTQALQPTPTANVQTAAPTGPADTSQNPEIQALQAQLTSQMAQLNMQKQQLEAQKTAQMLEAQKTAQQQQILVAQKTAQEQQKLIAQKTAEDQVRQQQRQTQHQILLQQAELQKEQIRLLKEQQEQLRRQQTELVQIQKTGSQMQQLGPFATGVAQSSQFAAPAASVLAAQPQRTGPFQSQTLAQSQPTGNGFQTQATGPFQAPAVQPISGMQPSTVTGGGFQAQRTGPFGTSAQPNTTGIQPTTTGPFMQPTTTGPFSAARPTTTGPFGAVQPTTTGPFGGVQPTTTGPFGAAQPTTTGPFGSMQPTTTGPFGSVQPTTTGPFGTAQPQVQPATTGPFGAAPFQTQRTGPFQAAGINGVQPTSFQPNVQPTTTGPFGSANPTGFTGSMPPTGTTPFQSQRTGPFQAPPAPAPTANPQLFQAGPFSAAQASNIPPPSYNNPSIASQRTGPFGQPPASTQPPLSMFNAQPTQPAQPTMPNFMADQQNMMSSQPTNMFSQPAAAPPAQNTQPQTSFNQFSTPLQAQATGFGFGNQPQKANVNNATLNDPFGLGI